MIRCISDKIGANLGWCPHARTLDAQTPRAGRIGPSEITDPEPPQPLTILTLIATPPWMTAVALAILVATLFVGGNIWWVAFVLVVLVALVVIHIRTVQIPRRA